MVIASTTRDWYGWDWKSLRNQLLTLCVQQADVFFEQLLADSATVEEVSQQYFDHMLTYVNQLVVHDQLGLWRHSLPLFENSARFAQWVDRDLVALQGVKTEEDGEALSKKGALGQLLRRFFELARREIIASDKNVSVNRVKTWERLNKISFAILSGSCSPRDRCCEEHFLALAQYIKKNHPKDKNLPTRPATIERYFLNFSDACIETIFSEDITAQEIHNPVETVVISDAQIKQFSEALTGLSELELACLDVTFDTRFASVSFTSKEVFLAQYGLNTQVYQKLLADTLLKAKPLLEQIGLAGFQGGDDD